MSDSDTESKTSRSNSSNSSGSSSSSSSNSKRKNKNKKQESPNIPKVPFYQKKSILRKELEIYQVDEDFEEEAYTVTGQTADDVVLPNIREIHRQKAKHVTKAKLQLPNKLNNEK